MILEYKITDTKYFNIKDVLKSEFKISDRLLTKLKKNNLILLNGISSYIDKTVNLNDLITVNINFEEESLNIVPCYFPLDIIFEDECLLIINKPCNMPVHPSSSHYTDTLSNAVAYYYNKHNIKTLIRPVNRLDKDTTGLVIFAKNEYVQENLIKQMQSKTFSKEYIAILNGIIEKETGTINAPISRKENSIIEREVNFDNGSLAITHYKLIKSIKYNDTFYSLVKLKLETGRTHQIRVHCKYINHPIIGDTLYGEESSIIPRQALHAYKISFIHPLNHKLLTFETTNLPKDMTNIINT